MVCAQYKLAGRRHPHKLHAGADPGCLLRPYGRFIPFVQRTTVGAAIRATAIDHDTARLMGDRRRSGNPSDFLNRTGFGRGSRSIVGPVLQANPLHCRVDLWA